MKRCVRCSRNFDVAESALKCPDCGAPFDVTSAATAFLPQNKAAGGAIHSTESADGARFPAGALLGERYRIVSLLGRGGMGEVYKAEDLKLKQAVALKFLPDAVAIDGASLARFQNEVRITRQISHPNVCRVYDIGEAQRMHFLSMEFIDGEDLSLLLRRIGRLPGDKANEIARQICAGLAAAHDNGVLHRDLKPANIMIDGRGRARITDFGLAVVAKELLGAEAGSGTPAYMAPEQLKGQQVSQRSDIYSLGLVLYELFTGKRVYDSDNITELLAFHESSAPTSPSSHIEHLDPLVERVIMRCLEREPNKRPATAIQVAAALPGGDPLAAALAAGETPSPEMVAASGETTELRPAWALTLLGAVLVSLLMLLLLGSKVAWEAQGLRKNSPEALKHRAEEIIQQLGYTDPPTDSAMGLQSSSSYRRWAAENHPSDDLWTDTLRAQPSALGFWYRQSPRYLESQTLSGFGWVTDVDPYYTSTSGMISVGLDPAGRLTWLAAVPPQVDKPQETHAEPDWTPLFVAAGLDPSSFTPTASTWTPLTVCDTRVGWSGVYSGQPDIPIRVDAAAYQGKPVHFLVTAPWSHPWRDDPGGQTTGQQVGFAITAALFLGVMLCAVLLARNNLRRGRGDRRGAGRLSTFVFTVTVLSWLFGAHHTPTQNEFFQFLLMAIGHALFFGAFIWLAYIALEPYVRRRWPETIIAWSRLVSGGLRDALVGRDLLIGVFAGVVFAIMSPVLENLIRLSVGAAPTASSQFSSWLGTRQFIAAGFLSSINGAIAISLSLFFLIFLFRMLTRRDWTTIVLFTALFSVMSLLGQNDLRMQVIPLVILFQLMTVVLFVRYGLLAMTVAMFISVLLTSVPLSADFSAWYSGYEIAALLVVIVVGIWGFHTSLGGQKLFSGTLLEE